MENKRNTGKGLPSKFSKTAPRVTKNTKDSKANKDSNSKSEDRPYKKPMGARNRKNAQMLYIGNLNYKISEKDLVGIFGKFGKVGKVNLVIDYKSKKSKGIAFVEMFDKEAVSKAIAQLDGKAIDGRVAKVSIAVEQKKKPFAGQYR